MSMFSFEKLHKEAVDNKVKRQQIWFHIINSNAKIS